MTLRDLLSRLPDEAECYVPGVGEVTVGEVRESGAEEIPALDARDWDRMVAAVEDAVTRNLCREPWEISGDGPPDGRA